MLLFVLFLFSYFWLDVISQQACSRPDQCHPTISDHFLYSNCTQGFCVCRKELGFFGNATLQSRCECRPPLTVYWLLGEPWCLNYSEAILARETGTRVERARNTGRNLYLGVQYPNPVLITYAMIMNQPHPYFDLFTNDTKGRISPVGTFEGLRLVVEYYIASGYLGTSRTPTLYFNTLMSQDGSSVFENVDIPFDQYNQEQTVILYSYNLTQEGEDKLNEKGRIYSGDKDILNLDAAVRSTGVLNFSDPAIHGYICSLLPVFGCNQNTDPVGYYHNFTDCMAAFSTWPGGNLGDTLFNGNSTACRYLHFVFVPVDPVLHCSHAGKLGGGKCYDKAYLTYYLHKYRKRFNSLNRRKKRYDQMSDEQLGQELEIVVNEIMFERRLDLLKAGVPENSPLIQIPLEHFMQTRHVVHTQKRSLDEMEGTLQMLKADNYLEWDRIIMKQMDSLLAHGVARDHPMIRDTESRMQERKKRGQESWIIDFRNTDWELYRHGITLPPTTTLSP